MEIIVCNKLKKQAEEFHDKKGFMVCGKIVECYTDCILIPETYEIYLFEPIEVEYPIKKGIWKSREAVLTSIEDCKYQFGFDTNTQEFIGSSQFFNNIAKIEESIKPIRISGDIFSLITAADYNSINEKMMSEEIINGFTPIEYAMKLYLTCCSFELQHSYKSIIIKLTKIIYKRDPRIMFDHVLLSTIKNAYSYDHKQVAKLQINGINDKIVSWLLINGDINSTLNFLKHNNKIDLISIAKYLHSIQKLDGLRKLLSKIQLSKKDFYDVVFETEMIDLLNEQIMEENYIKEIVKDLILGNKYLSLLYLIKSTKNFFDLSFEKSLFFYKVDYKIYKLLLKYGKLPKEIFHHVAESENCINVFDLLIQNGANINDTDKQGNTFLHSLVKNNNKNTELILNNLEEIINNQNSMGETAIILAAKLGNEHLVELLKNYGADLNKKDELENTVYHYICANNILLGSNINESKNKAGLTPINYTIYKKYYKIE